MKPLLSLDWCSGKAAKFAVESWHYSSRMPAGKYVSIGVWENSIFIGAIIFGWGVGNCCNGLRYGLARIGQMAELCRVALNKHQSEVSKIISISIRMLRSQSPGLKLLISLADANQGHIGTIYQAGNWMYTGQAPPECLNYRNGRWMHHRSASSIGSTKGIAKRRLLPKHRYLMPLDKETKDKIKHLSKPYPKRAGSDTLDTLANHAGKGGSLPTPALPLSTEAEPLTKKKRC